MTASFEDRASSTGWRDAEEPGPYDDMKSVLAELPRPRPVRMSRRGKAMAVVVSAILLASFGMLVAGLAAKSAAGGPGGGPPQLLTYGLPIALLVVMISVMISSVARQKSLLADGELATARVTKRWMARNGPNIRYEFTTPLGEHFSRGATDGSRQLSVGMSVPVFYDAQNPKKQLAACASFYEIVPPGRE